MSELTERLQVCLEDIEQGASVDAALARHPEHIDDLRPLVHTALAVRRKRPAPRAAFRAGLQVELAEVEQDVPGASTSGPRAWLAAWWPRLAGALLALVLMLGGLTVAAADSRPGEPLYPVRRGMTRVERALEATVDRTRVFWTWPGGAPTAVATATADDDAADGPSPAARRQAGVRPREGTPAVTTSAVLPRRTDAPPRGADAATQRPADRRDGPAPTAADDGRGAEDGPALLRPTRVVTREPGEPRGAILGTARAMVTARRPGAGPTARLPDEAPAPGAVRGRVRRPDGRPLIGRTVGLYPLRPPGGEPMLLMRRLVESGPDGRFAFNDVPPGAYKLALHAELPLQPPLWWYPGVRRPAEAERLVIGSGETRSGLVLVYGGG